MKSFNEFIATTDTTDLHEANKTSYTAEQFKSLIDNNKGREGKALMTHLGKEQASSTVIFANDKYVTYYTSMGAGGSITMSDKNSDRMLPLMPAAIKQLKSVL